jgi:hypothetical protein
MNQPIVPEQPRAEPEIIPPGDAHRAGARASFEGTQVYATRIGPFGFAMFALAVAAFAVVVVMLVLGAFVILLPLAGLLLAVAVASSLLRGWLRRGA